MIILQRSNFHGFFFLKSFLIVKGFQNIIKGFYISPKTSTFEFDHITFKKLPTYTCIYDWISRYVNNKMQYLIQRSILSNEKKSLGYEFTKAITYFIFRKYRKTYIMKNRAKSLLFCIFKNFLIRPQFKNQNVILKKCPNFIRTIGRHFDNLM